MHYFKWCKISHNLNIYLHTFVSEIPRCFAHITASSSLLYSSPDGQWFIPSQIKLDDTQNSVSWLQTKQKFNILLCFNFGNSKVKKSYWMVYPNFKQGCFPWLQWYPLPNVVIISLYFGEWWFGVHDTRSSPSVNRTISLLTPCASILHGSNFHGGVNASLPVI